MDITRDFLKRIVLNANVPQDVKTEALNILLADIKGIPIEEENASFEAYKIFQKDNVNWIYLYCPINKLRYMMPLAQAKATADFVFAGEKINAIGEIRSYAKGGGKLDLVVNLKEAKDLVDNIDWKQVFNNN